MKIIKHNKSTSHNFPSKKVNKNQSNKNNINLSKIKIQLNNKIKLN